MNCHFCIAHFWDWKKYNADIVKVAAYMRQQFGSVVPKPSYPQ